MSDYLPLLATLIALLLGLVVGKAWERYKLRDGRWIDRRRLREAPHYMLGLSFLAANQVDQAIDELTQIASSESDAVEIQMILGNLFREKGQVARAITIHQTLLQRPNLTKLEHAHVLLCLGLDYRHAGFVDRALEAFQEVLALDPRNRYALINLEKLHEEQHQWTAAFQVRERIAALDASQHERDHEILGFLGNEIGTMHHRSGEREAAARAFANAIDIDDRTAPAYLNLGDVREEQGDLRGAVTAWEQLARVLPTRAYLVLERLERAYGRLNVPHQFIALCEQVIARNPQDWRARLALSRHRAGEGRHREALELLMQALPNNPHGLAIHQEIWQALSSLSLEPALVQHYVTLTREAVFYLDPHVCVKCRYRSTELLWQCPQCHEWNTFVEERLAPAKDAGAASEAD